MIQYKKGNIVDETEGLIVHSCNCMKAMNSGLAKVIRNKWPIVYKDYLEYFNDISPAEALGTLQIIQPDLSYPYLYIGNLFGQYYYGYDGQKYASIEAIEEGFVRALEYCSHNYLDLKTVRLGCGLGGLSWDDEVKPIFEKWSNNKEYAHVDIVVFEP